MGWQWRITGVTGLSYRFREFSRVGGSQGNHGGLGIGATVAGCIQANGGMGIHQVIALFIDRADHLQHALIVTAVAGEELAGFCQGAVAKLHMPLFGILHQLCNSSAITVVEIKQKALKVARDHNIHTRRQALLQGASTVIIIADTAMENIVLVGGNYQLLYRQTHFVSQVTGKDVAEITGGHRK